MFSESKIRSNKMEDELSIIELSKVKLWISIEGCVGVGKTTVLKELSKINSDWDDLFIYPEPISEWEECLKLFYSNKKKYAFHMQIRSNLSFINIYNKIFKRRGNGGVFITERCSYSVVNIFNKMLYNDKKLTMLEYNMINELVDNTQKRVPDIIIYLKSNVDICSNRIIERGDTPINNIYLSKLIDYHDNFLLNNPRTVVINTHNKSILEIVQEIQNLIRIEI